MDHSNPLNRLNSLGQSIWLDFIDRSILSDGTLARLIQDDDLAGLTSNPAIFEKAISQDAAYTDDIAGPGRADLITLRGAELLKCADCIICDKLANPALLSLARSDAEIVNVPKRIGCGSFTQDQINEILLAGAIAAVTLLIGWLVFAQKIDEFSYRV